MLQFISGVFKGWKHETFGQCFLDSVWLIQEELPQSNLEPGGHWKHLFKPIQDAAPEVGRVSGDARLSFTKPEVSSTAPIAGTVVVVSAAGIARLSFTTPRCATFPTFVRAHGSGSIAVARVRTGARLFAKRVYGSGRGRCTAASGAGSPAFRTAGFGYVGRCVVETVHNPTEEMLLAIM